MSSLFYVNKDDFSLSDHDPQQINFAAIALRHRIGTRIRSNPKLLKRLVGRTMKFKLKLEQITFIVTVFDADTWRVRATAIG